MCILTELNRGPVPDFDRNSVAAFWAFAPGLVDRAWEAICA